MSNRLTTVPADAPIESLLPVFDQGMIAIVVEDNQFLGLISRIDVISYLRRKLS
jgi:cystathionine beta-synthase